MMERFWEFIETMKPGVWLVLIFVFHLLLYLAMGTETWFTTALFATATYGVVIVILKRVASYRRQRI